MKRKVQRTLLNEATPISQRDSSLPGMQKWASSILATHLLQTEAEITTTAADPYSEKYLRCIPRSSSRVWGRLENVYRYLCGLKTRAPPSETVHHLCDYPQRLCKRGLYCIVPRAFGAYIVIPLHMPDQKVLTASPPTSPLNSLTSGGRFR